MGGETHPIPSHGSRRRPNPVPWVKNFLQCPMGWDGMGLSHPMRSPDTEVFEIKRRPFHVELYKFILIF